MATTWRIVYHWDDETIKKDRREFSLTDEIMELINSWWGWGGWAINWVKVNWQVVNPDQAWYVWLTIPWVINNLSSNSTTDALSAKQWKVLYEYIQALQHVWHFLALWNTATWLPVTNPETSPYTYNTWDYYIVSNVAAAGWTNYKPNGSSYTINVASTTIESWEVQVNDLYFYDWYERRLLDNSWWGGSIAVDSSLSTTSTNPVQNAVITNRLNQMALDANTKTFWLTNLQDTTTGQAVRDWVDGGWNAIVYYSWMPYFITAKSATRITLYSKFTWTQNSPSNQSTGFTEQLMWIDATNSTVTTITNMTVWLWAPYLATNQNYSTVYTPLYDGSPATKKYVDDKFSAVPVYTAGSNIDITSNQISTIRNWYVYVTCTDAASTKAKTGTSAEGNYTPQEWDLIMIHFVNWCSVWWPTIAIDWWSAIPFYIWVDGANAGNMYFGSNNVSKMFIYTDGKLVWDAVKDNNTIYSAWTGLDLNSWVFSNTQPWPTVSSTAPTNPIEWDMWYDTTNDELKVYDGSSWDDTLGSNIKVFSLSTTSDIAIAQAAYDFGASWWVPIIRYMNETFIPQSASFSWWNAPFWAPTTFSNNNSYTVIDAKQLYLYATNGTVTQVNRYWYTSNTLSTWKDYTTPYTPQYAGSPSTKKYVDDKVAWAISSWTTAPSNPTEWQLWYDTTNDVLKVYDWTTWNIVWWSGWTNIVEVTVSTAYNTVAKVWTTTAGNYTPTAWDLLLVNFTVWCACDNPTLNIDWSWAKEIRIWQTNAKLTTFNFWSTSTNQKALLYYDWTYYRAYSTTNTTYSEMTNTQADTWTSTDAKIISPAVLKHAIKTWATSSGSTAPSSPNEWDLWYDTTNDVLKVYNGSAWVAVGWWWWGVAITDVTVSTAYSTAAKTWTTTAGNYVPAAWDLLMVNFVNGCSTSSAPTLAIDSWTAYNIRVGNTSATSTYFSLWSTSSSNVKVLMYFDWTYYKVWSTQNTTYSGMSQSTASTGTSTSSNLISAKVLNDTIVEKAITLDPNSPLTVTTIRCWTETQYNNLSSKWATTAYLCVEE